MTKLFAMLMCGMISGALFAEALPLKPDMLKKAQGDVGTLMEEDGLLTVELKGVTAVEAQGNRYFSFNVDLPEALDLTGKALKVRVKTDTPEVVRGFYVRAYNTGDLKKPVWSFQTWRPRLTAEYTDILLVPGENGALDWEKPVVSGAAPDSVKRLQFHIGTPQGGKEMNLKVKSVEVIDSPRDAMIQATAGIGTYTGQGRSRFAQNPVVTIEDGVIRIMGKSAVEYKQLNRYEGVILNFAEPINLVQKKLSFDMRAVGPTSQVYIRAYDTANKKTVMSFFKAPPPSEWTPVTLTVGQNGVFRWEGGVVDGGSPEAVTGIDFIFCTPKPGADFGIEIRNLKAE